MSLTLLSAIAAAGLQLGPLECHVTVGLGSFATGIDRGAAARVERLVAADLQVARATRVTLGPEGEYAICVRATSTQAATRLFRALKAALAEPVRAPVVLEGPEGGFRANVRR
jgi:hypothetical protein